MKTHFALILALLIIVPANCQATSKYPFKNPPENMKISQLHTDPAIYLIENFITDKEGQEIKKLATPGLERSKVGVSDVSDGRTSETTFLNKKDETVNKIAQRAADLLECPVNHIEIQSVHYDEGQKYNPHHDYFSEETMKTRTSQRLSTFFVYINDLPEDAGGHTAFPRCNLKIKPKKNAAVFWHNLDAEKNKDERTLHAGCPVKKGEKWAINIWVHDQVPH